MAKKAGTKHHALIKLSDLNKIFNSDEMIPIPKGFVKHISWRLSAHDVNLEEIPKDASETSVGRSETDDKSLQVVIPNFK